MTSALRFVVGTVVAVLLPALFPVEAHAQRIALLHADTAAHAETVKARLNAAGLADVTIIDVGDSSGTGVTPTLGDLQQYHAILTWSNFGYLNRDVLGDTLAAYVDDGGGIVQAAFSFDMGAASPGGRWDAEQYSVFTLATAEPGFGLALVPTQPAHPILNGTAFDPGGVNFFSASLLQGGSEAVAHWNNGYPLVATRPGPAGGNIVGLNLFPTMGEAGQLMAKSLQFVAADFVANPDGPAVALLAAGSNSGAADVRRKLRGLGVFSRVDTIDVSTAAVPSLATLLQYDAVLTWSAASYGDPVALGNVLADYVDANRGVVQAVFSYDAGAGLHLDGRWSAEGYRPLTEGVGSAPPFAPLTLLPVQPANPMLSGVGSFSGGTSSYHNAAALDGATTLVASWSDGQPLAAFGIKPAGGRVVALNMFPPSSDAAADLWDATTDGARLLANALVFAANHGPTVNAGDDQTLAAASPAGATFALSATASDLDGDALSFSWSGAVSATGDAIVVDVPPPPAPLQSHTVTVTLTVSDGKGGESTDTVDLTVTDLVAPELHGIPSDIAVEATGGSGATVPYGPVTATDAIDGDVPVVCSHDGEFPVGDTLVTCSASDSRGNTTSDSFTVTVIGAEEDAGPVVPGRMYGHGFVHEDNWYFEFAVSAFENASGAERGQFRLNVKSAHRARHRYQRRTGRFVSTAVASVTFATDSTVLMTGTGRWNGNDGYHYEVAAADKRTRRRAHDAVRITITSPSGEGVAQIDGELDGGSIRVFHHRH
jgi:hypothetical protein